MGTLGVTMRRGGGRVGASIAAALVSVAAMVGLLGAQVAPPKHADPAKRPPGDPSTRPGYWLAERKPIVGALPAGTSAVATQAAVASVLQLEHILRGNPALATPVGFVAATFSDVGSDRSTGAAAHGPPIPSTVHLLIWEYAYGDSTDFKNVPWGLDVRINQPRCMRLRPVAAFGAKVTDSLFYEPTVADRVHGFPRYRTGRDDPGVVVVSRSTLPEWVPVSAERFLTYEIAAARAAAGAAPGALNTGSATYDNWVKGRPERQKANAQLVDALRKSNPHLADSIRLTMDKAELQQDSILRQQLGATQAPAAANADVGGVKAAALQAELSHLSPAERQAPAVTDLSVPPPSGLARSGELLVAIVAPNPAFLDPSLSRAAPQVACVAFDPSGADPGSFPQVLFTKMVDQFPWSALTGWMRGALP